MSFWTKIRDKVIRPALGAAASAYTGGLVPATMFTKRSSAPPPQQQQALPAPQYQQGPQQYYPGSPIRTSTGMLPVPYQRHLPAIPTSIPQAAAAVGKFALGKAIEHPSKTFSLLEEMYNFMRGRADEHQKAVPGEKMTRRKGNRITKSDDEFLVQPVGKPVVIEEESNSGISANRKRRKRRGRSR